MFKFSAQPKTILKGNKQTNPQMKSLVTKSNIHKVKTPMFVPIGEDLLPRAWEKIKDPNEYFVCDRPKTPVYVPLQKKINKGTQIPKRDWLLFNFENEVQPVMEVLVAKILHQSKIEITKENEVEADNQKLHEIKKTRNAEIMTANIAVALSRLDPEGTSTFETNRTQFLTRLEGKLTQWQDKLEPLKAKPLVAYHNSFAYFARRFRLVSKLEEVVITVLLPEPNADVRTGRAARAICAKVR